MSRSDSMRGNVSAETGIQNKDSVISPSKTQDLEHAFSTQISNHKIWFRSMTRVDIKKKYFEKTLDFYTIL